MAGRVVWNGDKFAADFKREYKGRIKAACLVVEGHARELLSVAGTGVDDKGKTVYGANPSAPGEAPHKQHGWLRASVADEVEGMTGRVGTNLKYGRWLELGTVKMAARPWLRRALLEKMGEVQRLLTRRWS